MRVRTRSRFSRFVTRKTISISPFPNHSEEGDDNRSFFCFVVQRDKPICVYYRHNASNRMAFACLCQRKDTNTVVIKAPVICVEVYIVWPQISQAIWNTWISSHDKHTNILMAKETERMCDVRVQYIYIYIFGEQVESNEWEIWRERAIQCSDDDGRMAGWLPKHAACQDTSCFYWFLPFTRQLNLHCGDKLLRTYCSLLVTCFKVLSTSSKTKLLRSIRSSFVLHISLSFSFAVYPTRITHF